MNNPDVDRNPIEYLASEFIELERRGDAPDIDAFLIEHREHEAEVRELIGTMRAMERLKIKREAPPGAASLGPYQLKQLGDFRIIREVGRGGMGIVYEAIQESLQRRVAIKVLPQQALLDSKQLRRFEREARTAGSLHHPNIVAVHGVGEHERFHYYVMQFIDGVPLDDCQAPSYAKGASVKSLTATDTESDSPPTLTVHTNDNKTSELSSNEISLDETQTQSISELRRAAEAQRKTKQTRNKLLAEQSPPAKSVGTIEQVTACLDRFSFDEVARIGRDAADAIHYAHEQGVLHRDIKPGNLMLDVKGRLWITDFGLARGGDESQVTQTGDVVGTLRYLPPETFRGEIDARGDIYSLGITLYELITNRPAYTANTRHRLMDKVLNEEPVSPRKIRSDTPRDLATIVMKSIAKVPSRRYATAAELAADLKRWQQGKPIQARRISVPERWWLWSRRNPLTASLAGALGAAIILLGGLFGWDYWRTKVEYTDVQFALTDEQKARKQAEETSQKAIETLNDIYLRLGAADHTSEPASVTAAPVVMSDDEIALLESLLSFHSKLAEGSDDANMVQEVALAKRRVGDIRQRLGRSDEALNVYRNALAMYEAMGHEGPFDYTLNRAEICNEIGVILRSIQKVEEAKAAFQQAVDILIASKNTDTQPDARFQLARAYLLLGEAPSDEMGPPPPGHSTHPPSRTEAAVTRAMIDESISLLEALRREDKESKRYRHLLGVAYRESGRHLLPVRAREAFEQSRLLLTGLHQEFPAVADYQYDLAKTLSIWPLGLPNSPEMKLKQEYLLEAKLLSEQLVDRYNTTPSFLLLQLSVLFRLNRDSSRRGQFEETDEYLRRAANLAHRLQSDYPGVPGYLMWRATVHNSQGLELMLSRDYIAARKEIETGIDLLETELNDDSTFQFHGALSQAYATLAQVDRAQGLPAADSVQKAAKHRQLGNIPN